MFFVILLIIIIFIGGWLDKVGRRFVFIVFILGSVLEVFVVFFVMYFKLLIYCLFIGGFLYGICGYYIIMILVCMVYVVDII